MLPFRILISGMLLVGSLSADTVITSNMFDVSWGYQGTGNDLTTLYGVTGITASGATGDVDSSDHNWTYSIGLTTNLSDSLTFFSPFTENVSFSFTCGGSCDPDWFALTADFYLATDELADPLFAYPLPYSISMTSSNAGLGFSMQYWDTSNWSLGLDANTTSSYSFSGSIFPAGSGQVSSFRLFDNITLPQGDEDMGTLSGNVSISLGYDSGESVPEPATGLMLAAVLAAGFAWWRLRRVRSR